jgi:Glycolipid transfer protein (GLTP)
MCKPCLESPSRLQSPGALVIIGQNRLGLSPPLKRVRGAAAMVLVAAYIGKLVEDSGSTISRFLKILVDRPLVGGLCVLVYPLIAKAACNRNWLRFLRGVKEVGEASTSALKRVSSSETITRLRSSVSLSSMRILGMGKGNQNGRHSLCLSAPGSFATLSLIENLTLDDVGDIFRFIFGKHRLTFDGEDFLSNLLPTTRQVLRLMEQAVLASRGIGVTTVSDAMETDGVDDLDALAFAAVVRIFAEWRLLRLVPSGYQGYAVGMGLTKRDLVQNVAKIESAVHAWLDDCESRGERSRSGPTLRQLLEREIACGHHPKLPILSDKSAASGLVWITRQLRFQAAVFFNTEQVPRTFPTGEAAVSAAYKFVYEDYHGFFVKQIFQNSFRAAPDANVILDFMDLPRQKNCNRTACTGSHPATLNGIGSNHVKEEVVRDSLSAMEKLVAHIGSEWAKIHGFMSQCQGQSPGVRASTNVVCLIATPSPLANPLLVNACGRSDISAFLQVVNPLIAGLQALIMKCNVNDPTKV